MPITNPPGTSGAGLQTATQLRNEFIGDLLSITGDTRRLWLPTLTESTTPVEESKNGATLFHGAALTGRLSALGLGCAVSFNGTSHYAEFPDAADLSFGTGAADQAVSLFALVNVTDTANTRDIASKWAASNREWIWRIDTTDKLGLYLVDESAGITVNRTTDAAIGQGSWRFLAATYSGAGGATAANGITIYDQGLAVASTATNNASYVAMEDKAAVVEIGSVSAHTTGFFQGSMALVGICQKALTAHEVWALKRLVNAYFGLSL